MLSQQTISRTALEFIIERQSRGRTERTIKLYKLELNYFENWLKQKEYDTRIESLTPSILREWFSDLAVHRNKGGVHLNFRILRALLNFYDSEFDPIWKNPIKKVHLEPNKIPPLEEIPLSDVQQLLNICDLTYNPIRNKCILKILVDTGVRASELLALDICDINLETGLVKILHGKGDKFRICWMGKNAIKTTKEFLITRPNAKPEDPLIVTDENKRMQFFGLRALIVRLCRKANIKTYSPHCFRRCFGLTIYRKTHDLFLCQKLLGHSQPSVTMRYLNVNNFDLADAHHAASPADLLT